METTPIFKGGWSTFALKYLDSALKTADLIWPNSMLSTVYIVDKWFMIQNCFLQNLFCVALLHFIKQGLTNDYDHSCCQDSNVQDQDQDQDFELQWCADMKMMTN